MLRFSHFRTILRIKGQTTCHSTLKILHNRHFYSPFYAHAIANKPHAPASPTGSSCTSAGQLQNHPAQDISHMPSPLIPSHNGQPAMASPCKPYKPRTPPEKRRKKTARDRGRPKPSTIEFPDRFSSSFHNSPDSRYHASSRAFYRHISEHACSATPQSFPVNQRQNSSIQFLSLRDRSRT